MPTAEEHLRQDLGAIITQLMFQNAMLKADLDKLNEGTKKREEPVLNDGERR